MFRRLIVSIIFYSASIGPSAYAEASPICQNLSKISKGKITATHFNDCEKATNDQSFDFLAFMICHDLNTISKSGATATDINHCLNKIGSRRFNYGKLKQCKQPKNNSNKVLECLTRSRV